MSDIAERLRDIYEGDHERGCQGREYSCSCGWDQRCWDTAKAAHDEIERLRAELKDAHESLSYEGLKAFTEGHETALEEAALVAKRGRDGWIAREIAAEIRALKGKP